MKLRLQLVLVSLLALLLPWAGCSYVSQMESALRQGQRDALMSVTRTVAFMVAGRPDLAGVLLTDEFSQPNPDSTVRDIYLDGGTITPGQDIYMDRAERRPVVDGYPDSERPTAVAGRTFREHASQPGSDRMALQLWLGAYEGQAYLRADIDIPGVSNGSTAFAGAASYLIIQFDNAVGQPQRYRVSLAAPGEFPAERKTGSGWVSDERVNGSWQTNATGMVVELSLPERMLHSRFGVFALVAGAGNRVAERWVGSMAPNGQPGRLIQPAQQLDRQLSIVAGENIRLTVVDNEYWVRGSAGRIEPAAPPPASGAWLLEAIYRMAAPDDMQQGLYPDDQESTANVLSGNPRYEGEREGKLRRGEVTLALSGRPESIWYLTDSDNNLAVISAAYPVRINDTYVGAVVAEESSAGIVSLTNATLSRIAGVSFVLTAVIVAVLVGYAGWLSARILRLSGQVERVMDADGRELGSLPPQTAPDELGALGRSFSRMLRRVHGYTDYLKTLAAKLSHELRTPLAVVRSSLDNLEHEELSPSAQDYLRRARGGSERLERILNAMSAAARVEQSIANAELQSMPLNNWLQDNVAGYRSAYPASRIVLELPAEMLVARLCPDLMSQLLDKLMENAADFCASNGEIRFGLKRQGRQIELSVANDGPLLPDDMEQQLFESMVSVRADRSESVHMGLGLTIVRLVAELHGGSVTAKNRAAGDGVTFLLRIPAV